MQKTDAVPFPPPPSRTAPASLPARNPGIDLLRGLAVLFVVLHHIHLRFKLNHFEVGGLLPDAVGRVVFWSGYQAVIAFFVISGFLITRLSIARWGHLGAIPPRAFYGLRLARLAPCLLLLLSILSLLHLAGVPGYVINPERASLGRALLAALGVHVNWLEGRHGYLPGSWDVLWSLSVEEAFYLAFPLACRLLRNERLLLLPLAALVVIGPCNRLLLAGQEPWDGYAYLSGMDGFAFGCLAAMASARLHLGRNILRASLAIGAAACLLVLVDRNRLVDFGPLYVTVLEAGVALLCIAFARSAGDTPPSRAWAVTAPLQAIGRDSYEIYLSHMFVVLGLVRVFKDSGQGIDALPLWYGAMLLLSVASGGLVARLYSAPLNRWLRRQAAGPAVQAYPPL